MSKQELIKRLVCFKSITKSYSGYDLIVTERKLLDMCITEEKKKGRITVLPNEYCTRKRCDNYEYENRDSANCRKCIKDFYGVE